MGLSQQWTGFFLSLFEKDEWMCATRFFHDHLSTFHTILNIYSHGTKNLGIGLYRGCYTDEYTKL